MRRGGEQSALEGTEGWDVTWRCAMLTSGLGGEMLKVEKERH
jgi:hypothetical protein